MSKVIILNNEVLLVFEKGWLVIVKHIGEDFSLQDAELFVKLANKKYKLENS